MGATIRDVAARAGVSTATVSRALSGSPLVAPEMRDRIRAVASDMGYVASRLPTNLRAKNVRILALVVGNVRNAYFPELIDGCAEAAHLAGFPLIFGDSNEDPERESEILDQLAIERVSGVALATAVGVTPGLRRLLDLGIPVVAVDRRIDGIELDTVTAASEDGVAGGVRHLIELGHRRIALIGGPRNLSTIAERAAGYERALKSAGIKYDDSIVAMGDLGQEFARLAIPRLMGVDRPPTALVTMNDLSSIGAMHGLRHAGLAVPADVSLIGVDDLPGADLFAPPLTAIAQPVFAIGRRAIEMLARRVAAPGAPAEEVVLPMELVIRASTSIAKVHSVQEV